MNHHNFQPQNLHDLNRYIASSDDDILFIMDNNFVTKAVDGNKSHSKCQESTSLVEKPSPKPRQDDTTICTTYQTQVDVLAEHIITHGDEDKHMQENKRAQEIRPFHPNLLSMIQLARAGCPFCVLLLEAMQWPLLVPSHQPNLMDDVVYLTLNWGLSINYVFFVDLYLENQPNEIWRIDIATEGGIYFDCFQQYCRY